MRRHHTAMDREAFEHTLREEHAREWQILSGKNGKVAEGVLRRWMEQRKLASEEEVLVYLRGDGGVTVGASLIEGAGQGLFAAKDFKKGDLVCVYRGRTLSLGEVNKLCIDDGERDYIMGGFSFVWHVDAKDSPSPARYINDVLHTPGGHNLQFVKLSKDMAGKAVALRDIREGEELYAKYGDSFWRKRGIECPYDAL